MIGMGFSLDQVALNITKQKPQEDIRELDFNLWLLVKEICMLNQPKIVEHLGFSEETVKAIAEVEAGDLFYLTSGVMLSFGVTIDTQKAIALLKDTKRKKTSYFGYLVEEDKRIEKHYWRLVRETALMYGEAGANFASFKFGLPIELTQAIIESNHAQILHMINNMDFLLYLRYDQSLVKKLIDTPKKATLHSLKYLQIISNMVSLNHKDSNSHIANVKEDLEDSLYDLQDEKGSYNAGTMSKRLLARLLCILGAANNVIAIETGLKYKSIASVEIALVKDGVPIEPKRVKTISNDTYVVSNTQKSIQATLIMMIYKFLAPNANEIRQNIHLFCLLFAFGLYNTMMNELRTKWERLSFTECWILARDLRDAEGKAYYAYSDRHKIEYYVPINQTLLKDCPFDNDITQKSDLIAMISELDIGQDLVVTAHQRCQQLIYANRKQRLFI